MILQNWLLTAKAASAAAEARDLYLVGLNQSGQIGDGTTVAKSTATQIGALSWKTISVGASHTVAIRSDDLLYAWGKNHHGQLGDNTFISKSSPVQIGTSSWSTVSAKNNTTFGITTDNKLFGWGLNTEGSIGDGATSKATSWAQIVSGNNFFVGIRSDGALFSWGDNTFSTLGTGDLIHRKFPTLIDDGSWSMVAAGRDGAVGIKNNLLYAWGNNASGEVGNGRTSRVTAPIQIGSSSWTRVSMKNQHVLAIRSDGGLFAWGNGQQGVLGLGAITSLSSPVQIGTSSWTFVAAGGTFSGAIRIDGGLFAWGNGGQGAMGRNSIVAQSSPVQIGTSSWTLVASAGGPLFDSVAAIRSDGTLFTWGNNASGQLGDNTPVNKSSPVQIGAGTWKFVAGGANLRQLFFGITTSDLLFAWGRNNSQGFLGDGSTIDRSSPVQIGTETWSSAAAGETQCVAVRSNGLAYAFGLNNIVSPARALGYIDGTNVDRSSPVLIATNPQYPSPVQIGSSSWIAVSAGEVRTYAIRSDNLLFGWGSNDYGRLGNNSFDDISSPVQIGTSSWIAVSAADHHAIGIDTANQLYMWGSAYRKEDSNKYSWLSVAVGSRHSAAIRSDGALFTWGANFNGQLGDGTTISKSFPIQIGTDSWTFVTVNRLGAYTGSPHVTFAIRNDGGLFTWGGGTGGILGSGLTTSRSSPVQVGTSSWVTVDVGLSHAAGILFSTSGLYTWGLGTGGTLGSGTTTSRSSPVQVGTSTWSKVSCGGSFTHAIRLNGTLWTWGNNGGAQPGCLGDATTVSKSSPVQIGSSAAWTEVSAGLSHSQAINANTLYGWGNGPLIGDNTSVNKSAGVQIGVAGSFYKVTTGPSNTMALGTNGALWAWGSGIYNLGTPLVTNVGISTPVQILAESWTSIAVGISHAAAISKGRLFTWGNGTWGELGDGASGIVFGNNGESDRFRALPIQLPMPHYSPVVISSTSSWSAVSAGKSHNLAIDVQGYLYGWGGFAAANSISNMYSWKMISAGNANSGAIRSDGALFMWGRNANGEHGDGTTVAKLTPVQIGTSSWTMVSCGGSTTAGITSDGRLLFWGSNSFGQYMTGNRNQFSVPTESFPGTSWKYVSVGNLSTAAINATGILFTSGFNGGQLGDGTTINRSSATQIGSSSWTMVTVAGYTHAIRSDGALFGWGGTGGGIGNGLTSGRSSPVQIGTESWIMVTSKRSTILGLYANGTMLAWGFNDYGQIGDGTTQQRSSPVIITASGGAVSRFIYVGSGNNSSAAIDTEGRLYTWGNSQFGQVHSVRSHVAAVNIGRSSPLQIRTLIDGAEQIDFNPVSINVNNIVVNNFYSAGNKPPRWKQVDGSIFGTDVTGHFLALRDDPQQSIYAWGRNFWGALGDSTTEDKFAANAASVANWSTADGIEITKIGTVTWNGVVAGNNESFAIDSSNTLYGWGYANNNTLSPNTIFVSTPTSISAAINTASIYESHAGYIKME